MKIKEVETRLELYLELPKGGVGAEIGVCKGVNSIQLYHVSKPSKLYLCDVWAEKAPGDLEWFKIEDPNLWYGDHKELVENFFKQEIEDGKVETRRQLGGDFLYSLDDNSLDWVYLDADHAYDAVHTEVTLALHKVKPGGFIMGHDYAANCQVWRAGVIRAVNQRLNTGELKMQAISIERWSSFLCKVVK